MSREQTITQYISTLLEKEGERGRFEKEAEKNKPRSGLMTNRNEPKKDEPVDMAPKVMSSADHLFNAVEEMSRYVDDSGSDALTDSISRSVRIPNVPTSIDRRTPLVDLYRLNMGGETEQGFLKAPAAPVAPSIDTEGKGKPSFAQSMINSLRRRYQEKRINPNVKSFPEQNSITATELDGAAVGGASDGKVDEGLISSNASDDPSEESTFGEVTQGEGLMSRGPEFSPIKEAKKYNNAFNNTLVDDLLEVEGMGGDTLTSVPTYSFGITEEKANEYGLEPSQFDTMREFAIAFSDKYVKEKKKANRAIFDAVDEKDHIALMSYLWNTGSFGKLQKKALLNNDMEEFIHEMRDVVHTEGHSSSGLSARRAKEANLIGKNIEGWEAITKVAITGTRASPTFEWQTSDGTVVETFNPTKSLHPGNLPSRSTKDALDDEILI